MHERVAVEIFRQVLIEYQALNELGPRERTETVSDWLMDVDQQLMTVISVPMEEFRKTVLEPLLMPIGNRDIVAAGRLFAATGVWPISAQHFERPRSRAK